MEWKGKNIEELTRDELRSALSELGLPNSGDKKGLLLKLQEAIGQSEGAQAPKGRRTTKILADTNEGKTRSAKSVSERRAKSANSVSEAREKGRRKKSGETNAPLETMEVQNKISPDKNLAEAEKPTTRRSRKESVDSEVANSNVSLDAPPAAPSDAAVIPDDLEKRTVVDLKNMLRALQLPITGVKSVLVDRIRQHHLPSKESAAPAPSVEVEEEEEGEEDSDKELDTVQDIDGMSYRELQAALKERGLNSKGTKVELADRLKTFLQRPPKTPQVLRANVISEPVLVRTPPVATLFSGNLQTLVKVDPNIGEEKRSERMKRRREKTEKDKENEIVKRIKFEEPAEEEVDEGQQQVIEDVPPAKRRRTKSTTTKSSKASASSKKTAEEVKKPTKPKRKAPKREAKEDIEEPVPKSFSQDTKEREEAVKAKEVIKNVEELMKAPKDTAPPVSSRDSPGTRRTRPVVNVVGKKSNVVTEEAAEMNEKPILVDATGKAAKTEDSKKAPSMESSHVSDQVMKDEAAEVKGEIKNVDGLGDARSKNIEETDKQDEVKANEITKQKPIATKKKKVAKKQAVDAVADAEVKGGETEAEKPKAQENEADKNTFRETSVTVKVAEQISTSPSKTEHGFEAQPEEHKEAEVPGAQVQAPAVELRQEKEVPKEEAGQVVDIHQEKPIDNEEATKAMLKLGEVSAPIEPIASSKATEPSVSSQQTSVTKVDEGNLGATQFVSVLSVEQTSIEIVTESEGPTTSQKKERSDLMEVEGEPSMPEVDESQPRSVDAIAPIVQNIVDHIVSNATHTETVQTEKQEEPKAATPVNEPSPTEAKPPSMDSTQAALSISTALRGPSSVDRAEEIYQLIAKSLDASAATSREEGSRRYSSTGLSFETANEDNSVQEEGSSPLSVASSPVATSPEPESRLPLAVTALELDPESVLQRDEELFNQLEAALMEATRAGITMAEFEVLDAVLQSFVPMSQSSSVARYPTTPSTTGQRGRSLDESFMQYTQPRSDHPRSNLAYAPTPILPPTASKPTYFGWRNSAVKAQRPPVPLFSPQPTPLSTPAAFSVNRVPVKNHSATKPAAKSAVAERILNVLREEHVPMTRFVFTPAPRVFGVSPLVRADLISRVSGGATTLEFGFDK